MSYSRSDAPFVCLRDGIAPERWHQVQLRSLAGVVKLGEIEDPVAALTIGKEIVQSQAFGSTSDIISVEVLDPHGNLVLGEEVRHFIGGALPTPRFPRLVT